MKIIALLCIVLCLTAGYNQSPDTIFLNGNIYTLAERQPRASALAVKGDRIIFVGSNDEARQLAGKTTRIIDLHGRTVVPGLTDAHYHLASVGEREISLNLEGTTSLADLLARVKARVDKAAPGEWITGGGWIETFWQPPVFPTRADLDKVAPNNPLFLKRADGHGAVVNSAALKLAGIDKNTPDPFGGQLVRDKATGELNGMVLDAAKGLITKHIPPLDEAGMEKRILLGVQRSIELGWCQIQDAGGSYSEAQLMQRLYREGKIKLRIYKAVYGPGESAQKLLENGAITGAFDHRFNLRAIKVFMDGALGSRGAAMLAPYEDFDTSGLITSKEEELIPLFREALIKGVQIETHAIGDRGNRQILDIYEKVFSAVPHNERKIAEPRWRIEHAQILNPADIGRFRKLNIIPSMQPSHAISDLHFAPKRIGIKRLEGAYAWQSLIKSGVPIAGGSDAPVERGEPMIEFYAAVARKDQQGFSGEGWHPEQALTREQALKLFTRWAAYAAFEEGLRGAIEPGKLADLTVLSADIMTIPEPDILKTRSVMTVIGGEVVFQDHNLFK